MSIFDSDMKHPLDVLLIAPLNEEAKVCRTIFPARGYAPDRPFQIVDPEVLCDGKPMSVGLFVIGEVGALSAAIQCFQVLDSYRPKVVLLLGIAAGNSEKLAAKGDLEQDDAKHDEEPVHDKDVPIQVGDVIYNERVLYHSYARVSDPAQLASMCLKTNGHVVEFEVKIRSKDPIVRNDDLLSLAEIVGRASRPWKQIARRAIRHLAKIRNVHHKPWGVEPQDPWDTREPNAHLVTFASGEHVIVSKSYQDFIRAAFPSEKIFGFDMEAYAVGRVCAHLGISFLTIRGVSDPGTAKKAEDRDRYHCAAAAISAAFARKVIELPGFDAILRTDRSQKGRHVIRCLDLNLRTGCPNQHSCVTHPAAFGGSPVLLSRLYDGLDPIPYSRGLLSLGVASTSSSTGRIPSDVFVLYVFPYAPDNLRALIYDHKDGYPKLVEAMEHEKWPVFTEQLKLVLPHFAIVNALAGEHCSGWKAGNHNGPPPFARIIVTNEDNIFPATGRNSIYEAFLGRNVPTYHATREQMNGWQFCIDDMVITGRTLVASNMDESFAIGEGLQEYRYFKESRFLVVRGHQCQAAGGVQRLPSGTHAYRLAEFWAKNAKRIQDAWKTQPMSDDFMRRLPSGDP